MSDAIEKLHLLARQARALAVTTSDRKRADALRGLAVIYTKQAEEIEDAQLISAPSPVG